MAKKTGLHLLTPRQVLAAETDQNDGGGLFLRVEPIGAKWSLRFTAPDGRRRELGLGVAYRDTLAQAGASLADAREAARRAADQLRAGLDPIEERERARREAAAIAAAQEAEAKAEATRQRLTLAYCARDFHERVIEPSRTTKHAAQWISSLENHIPAAIWNKPIADVTAPELLEALSRIKPHKRARNLSQGERIGETVRRVRQRLEWVFEDAIFNGWATVNPAAALKRKMRESMPKKRAGSFAALPYKDAPALLARLRTAPGSAARCLEFAVLTAARTSEALGAVWAEFDLQAGVWLVPAERMKASGKDKPEPHTVHLSARALAILQGQQGQHDVWVFPSPMVRPDRPAGPLSNMAMLTTLTRLGVRDQTTVHGLCRATFSTWAYDTAAARPDVIEACLAHREADKVKAAYNRAQFTQERQALLTKWATYLQGAQVIPLPVRAA